MAKGTIYRGTCAWCFRDFSSTNKIMTQRHGWKEVNAADVAAGKFMVAVGGREVGSYGNVVHMGDCGGMPFPPYELGTDGTKARLAHEKEQLVAWNRKLSKLAERPDFIETGKVRMGNWRTKDAEYQVKVRDGDDFEVDKGNWSKDRYKYERIHARYTAAVEMNIRAVEDNIKFCEKMIAKWKLDELKPFEARKATVHLQTVYRNRKGSLCGNTKSYGLTMTEDEAEVTCTRCQKTMDSIAKERAERNGAKDNGRAIYDWLWENHSIAGDAVATGGVPAKVIKTALGLTQKEFNKAVETLERYDAKRNGGDFIGQNYDSPITYYAAKGDI
jgi:hypothetical protein